ncbi:putative Phosphate ABC transporter substrate-binding protein (PhoT family) [uncultured Gammaproteobacteria bacterium]
MFSCTSTTNLFQFIKSPCHAAAFGYSAPRVDAAGTRPGIKARDTQAGLQSLITGRIRVCKISPFLIIGIAAGLWAAPVAAQVPGSDSFARTHIVIYASTLVSGFAGAIAKHLPLSATAGDAVPQVTPMLADPAIKAFCAGVGPNYPDVVASPRRMAKREFELCDQNGVIDIVELSLGFDALVAVVKKGNPVFDLTPRMLYYATAAQIPKEDDFVPNPIKRWKEIDPKLPDLEIRVIASENGTAINYSFKEFFLESGCRGLRQFKEYYSAEDRVKQCTTLREDGLFQGIKAPIAVNFKDPLRNAPAGTVAIIPHTVYRRNMSWLDVLPVSGQTPSDEAIRGDDYDAVFPVRIYVKRSHMESKYGGKNVVAGLYEFIREAMSEEAIGNGGYLEMEGLVVDDLEDRKTDREKALRLERFKR